MSNILVCKNAESLKSRETNALSYPTISKRLRTASSVLPPLSFAKRDGILPTNLDAFTIIASLTDPLCTASAPKDLCV